MRGFDNYYSFASNHGQLAGYLTLILKRSCSKLLAAKLKLRSMKATYLKFSGNLTSPKGANFVKLSYKSTGEFRIKASPVMTGLYALKSLATLYDMRCIVCDSQENIEMHHVKHIRKSNKKAKGFTQLMSKLNRKQIPVCSNYHVQIHNGKYDGISLKDLHLNKIKASKKS